MNEIFNGTDPAFDVLRSSYEMVFIPVMNPDGYEWTWTNEKVWSGNRNAGYHVSCRGVHLDRNWPVCFAGADSSNNPCATKYHGPMALSEPETFAVSQLLASISNLAAVLDFRADPYLGGSNAGSVLWPYGDVCSCTDPCLPAIAASMSGTKSYFQGPLSASPYGPAGGVMIDWCHRALKVPAFQIYPENPGTNQMSNTLMCQNNKQLLPGLAAALPSWPSTGCPEITFGNLPHRALGGAVLTSTSAGLEVSNIGSSGQDGVEIELPTRQSPGFGHQVSLELPASLPAGASLKVSSLAEVGGAVQAVGEVSTRSLGNGTEEITPNFASGREARMEVWSGGVVIRVIPLPITCRVTVTIACGKRRVCILWGKVCFTYPTNCKATLVVTCGLSRSSEVLEADEIRFIDEGATVIPGHLVATLVQAAQIPSFTISSEATLAGVNYSEGLGGANTLNLTGTGSSFLGETFAANTSPVATSAFTILSARPAQLPIFGGTLLVDLTPPTVTVNPVAVGGTATQLIMIPNVPALAGQSVYLQSIVFDPTQPLGLALSHGNELRIVQ